MTSKCPYDPKDTADQPMGMYHCPLCGNMVVAGMDHPDYSLLPEDPDPWRGAWFNLLDWLCTNPVFGEGDAATTNCIKDIVTHMRARAKEIACKAKDT